MINKRFTNVMVFTVTMLMGSAVFAKLPQKVHVFPFNAVNVDASVAEASHEVFQSEISQQGVTIVDWQLHKTEQTPEKLDATSKVAIVQTSGVGNYFDGKIVKLGSKITVTVNLNDANGNTTESKTMNAASENDLHLVFNRIALAFEKGVSPQETQNVDNTTAEEAQKVPNRARIRMFQGGFLGGGAVFGPDALYGFVMGGYDMQFEYKNLRLGLYLGATLPGDLEHFTAIGGGTVAGFLNNKGVSPYIGGGIGTFLGFKVGDVTSDVDDEDRAYGVGFEAFPVFGIEFLRQARLRFHLETRYHAILDLHGNFGHGPSMQLGLSFY